VETRLWFPLPGVVEHAEYGASNDRFTDPEPGSAAGRVCSSTPGAGDDPIQPHGSRTRPHPDPSRPR
jgi:hypothetical protein